MCPFHWWEWAADGTNAGIPYSERTNKKARLRTYPTIERNGLVLFWFHPDPAQEPLWEIPDLSEYLTDEWVALEPAEWTVRCPWQDSPRTRPTTSTSARSTGGRRARPRVARLRRIRLPTAIDRRLLHAAGPDDGSDRHRRLRAGLLDRPVLGNRRHDLLQRDGADRLGDDLVDEAVPVRGLATRVGEALVRDLKKQMAEDNVIFDNKIQQPTPALADADGPILQFRKWAAQFYVDGDPVRRGKSITMSEERYGTDDSEVDIERVRLGMLAATRDPKTFRVLEGIGVDARDARARARRRRRTGERVAGRDGSGPTGRVMSTDIDLQFHGDARQRRGAADTTSRTTASRPNTSISSTPAPCCSTCRVGRRSSRSSSTP